MDALAAISEKNKEISSDKLFEIGIESNEESNPYIIQNRDFGFAKKFDPFSLMEGNF